jgi:coenzyme F420-reducing hydrogenase delta subunit
MCSGRVDLSFIIRAFSSGMDGVFIGGCHLNECHYITDGNHHAAAMVQMCKKLLTLSAVNPERLKIESLSAGEGIRFAEVMNEFSKAIKALGPLGDGHRDEFNAIAKLIPYIRLVERERFRVRFNTVEEYAAFFQSAEVDALFRELVADKVMINRIVALLRKQPCSTGELSSAMKLPPSEITQHLQNGARHGFARFDEDLKQWLT